MDYATGSQPVAVAFGDFNGDGKLDLAVANQADSTVSVLLGNGDGTFAAGTLYSPGGSPSALAVVDLNGDGIIGNDEILRYIDLWQNGIITMEQLLPAIDFWNAGTGC